MALVNAVRRAPVRVVWKPIPGLLYKSPKALESVLKEKKMKGVHIQERAERGLFGGKRVRTSWKVGGDKRRKNYTKRWRKPNAQKRWIVSEVLEFRMQVNMTVSAMRDMDFYGSFDEYILKASERKIDSAFGIVLKRAMYAKIEWEKEQQERYERELAEWNKANSISDGSAESTAVAASSSPSGTTSKKIEKKSTDPATATDSTPSPSPMPSAAAVETTETPLTPEQEQDAHPLLSPDRPTLVETVLRAIPESISQSPPDGPRRPHEQSDGPRPPQENPVGLFPVMGKQLALESKNVGEGNPTYFKINKAIRSPVSPLPLPRQSEVDLIVGKLKRSGTKPREFTLRSRYKPQGRSTYWPPEKSIRSPPNFCSDESGEEVLEMTPKVILDMVQPKHVDFVGFEDTEALEKAKETTRKCDDDIKVAILPRVDTWSYKELKRRAKKHAIIVDSMAKKSASSGF